MEKFVTYDLSVKLKEKGFTCELPFAMYNELGSFHLLTTSAPYYVCSSGYKARACYDYDDFDEKDCVAPTISQVLKWLRDEKLILIGLSPMQEYDGDEVIDWCATVYNADKHGGLSLKEEFYYQSYEEAACVGIEYVLDNLI